MTDLMSLVEPVRRLVPDLALTSPGDHPLSGLLASGDLASLTTDVTAGIPALVDTALTGVAGTAAVQRLGTSGREIAEVLRMSEDVEQVARQASTAVEHAATDILAIAADCLQQVTVAVAAAPLAPGMPGAALQIACAHLIRAQERLTVLGDELGQLVDRVDRIDTALPEAAVAPVPPGSPSPVTGEARESDSAAPAESADSADPGETTAAPTPEAAAAVDAATSALGTPYVWGGTTPGEGFDCSGLTQWAYAQAGVDIPRTADQQAVGAQVSADDLAPGDLVVWDGHVAMITGDGQMIEAGDPVQISPVRTENIGMNFLGFHRPTA